MVAVGLQKHYSSLSHRLRSFDNADKDKGSQ